MNLLYSNEFYSVDDALEWANGLIGYFAPDGDEDFIVKNIVQFQIIADGRGCTIIVLCNVASSYEIE